ncbi:hypothetical protein QJS66_02400 [Kocuria rhizophila]|nr:hypothetical protein QJS66_02400 [Kocuria rhizophila]
MNESRTEADAYIEEAPGPRHQWPEVPDILDTWEYEREERSRHAHRRGRRTPRRAAPLPDLHRQDRRGGARRGRGPRLRDRHSGHRGRLAPRSQRLTGPPRW